LAKGECVTTPNGNVVRPEQVKEPDKISSIFIVVDCPSLDHIPSLVSQDRLKDESLKQHTQNIIHILGDPDILRNDQYKAWMNGFSDNCNVSIYIFFISFFFFFFFFFLIISIFF